MSFAHSNTKVTTTGAAAPIVSNRTIQTNKAILDEMTSFLDSKFEASVAKNPPSAPLKSSFGVPPGLTRHVTTSGLMTNLDPVFKTTTGTGPPQMPLPGPGCLLRQATTIGNSDHVSDTTQP